ncbi:MAG: hypothetical protein JWP81_4901 [Ferruginibacter sp.]|nr:hypothetical protein [Ferruginibacter sp.]
MFSDKNNRRDFLKKASLVSAVSMASMEIFAGPYMKRKITLNENDVVLFQAIQLQMPVEKERIRMRIIPQRWVQDMQSWLQRLC